MGITDWVGDRWDSFLNVDKSIDRWRREYIADPVHRFVYGDNTDDTKRAAKEGGKSPEQIAHDALMRDAYNPSRYHYPTAAPAAPAAVESTGPGDGGLGSMLNSINQQYQQQIDALNRNRDRAATDIASQYSNVQAQQRSNNAAYSGDASRMNAEIMNRIAQQLADSRSAAADDAKFARAFGLNGAAIAANGANIARTNQNVSGYQQDLMRRLQMVQQGAQSNYANSAGLINQGATGRLTNTFNQALAAADLAKAEATAKAQSAASSAASRASSSGSAKSQLSETKARAQLELLGRMDPATYAGFQAWKASPTTEGISTDLINLYGLAAMAGL